MARSEDRPVARGGSARVWVGGDGLVTRYEITIRVRGVLGNAEDRIEIRELLGHLRRAGHPPRASTAADRRSATARTEAMAPA